MTDCDDDKTALNLGLFSAEPKPIKVELIRRSLANINCGERDFTQGHYENILRLAEQNVTGRKIELPGGFSVRWEYGNLIFLNRSVGLAPPISSGKTDNSFAHAASVEIPGQTTFENSLMKAIVFEKNEVDLDKFKTAKTNLTEWFDLDKIKQPLIVRRRRPGDRFVPLGQSTEKKIGKFLTAQRIPHGIRRDVLVVTDREKIIWIWPVRISERAKINGQTRKILQLKITDLST
jgi:tRNA(Ile)-lysidine synthase